MEAATAARDLREEVGETAAAQAELDAAAADFRALHAERLALTARWDEALSVLARRASLCNITRPADCMSYFRFVRADAERLALTTLGRRGSLCLYAAPALILIAAHHCLSTHFAATTSYKTGCRPTTHTGLK